MPPAVVRWNKSLAAARYAELRAWLVSIRVLTMAMRLRHSPPGSNNSQRLADFKVV